MSDRPTIDWREIVARHASAAGVPDLSDRAVEELAAHLDEIHRAALRSGAGDAEARERAMAALDESPLAGLRRSPRRGSYRLPPLAVLSPGQALVAAGRQLRAHRRFAALAVLVLGLGSGASAVVYTVVDRVLLQPLPYAEPERLLSIWDVHAERDLRREPLSPVNFMDYRALPVFTDAAAWWRPDVNLTDADMEPVRVRAIETGANLFEVLGVRPQIGPGFPAGGPMFSKDLVAVISDRLWRSRYQADPGLIGRPVTLNGSAYTIVGVMPPRFDFPGDVDVWQRSRWDFQQHSRAAHFMYAVARLAPSVRRETAETALTALTARLGHDFAAEDHGWSARLVPLLEDQLGYYRPALVVLFGAVGLLTVISCLNVASLLLTRALSREREMAVRTALGASPWHLMVQLLAEGTVLSVAGGIVGVAAAAVALPVIVASTPVGIPRLAEAAINFRVLGFTLGVAVATTVVFGLVPALVIVRPALTSDLKSGDRGVSRTSRVVYRALVAGEVALAGALLVMSALLVRTVAHMMDVDTGVGTASVMTTSVQLTGRDYAEWPTVAATFDALLDDIRQQRGVRAAGASNFLPLDPGWRQPFGIEGQAPWRRDEAPQAQIHSVSDGWFESMGARLRWGRLFTRHDTTASEPVVIVNEAFARRYLPGPAGAQYVLTSQTTGIGPLGRNLVRGGRFMIVGVVADVKDTSIGQPTEPAVYFLARQFPFRAMYLTVDAVDAPAAVAAVRASLRRVAPGIPLTDTQTWTERLRARTAEPRLLMTLLVFFGGLAALLAVLGVYGLFAWSVALRQRELAIRLTLGAPPAAIGALVLRQGALLAAGGLAAGWLMVRSAERALTGLLFGVSPSDLTSVLTAASLLFAASLLACLPPAWRAMRVDPVQGLRTE